jgi:uncharacterized protein
VGLAAADVLAVFVKEPRAGAVKARLAARLGPDLAAAVYRAMAQETLRATAPRRDEYERVVFFAPAGARAAIGDWLPAESLHAQQGSDLGARMAGAFEEVFARGARRVALVGSDAPRLSREDVRDALASLDHHDLVLGPAADGGYYLIALRAPRPALLRDIEWSTPAVLASTLARAASLDLEVRLLRTLGDVDTAEDLAADWARLAPILPEGVRVEVAAALFPPAP